MSAPSRNLTAPTGTSLVASIPPVIACPVAGGLLLLRVAIKPKAARFGHLSKRGAAPCSTVLPLRPIGGGTVLANSVLWRYKAARRGWQIYPSGRNR